MSTIINIINRFTKTHRKTGIKCIAIFIKLTLIIDLDWKKENNQPI